MGVDTTRLTKVKDGETFSKALLFQHITLDGPQASHFRHRLTLLRTKV